MGWTKRIAVVVLVVVVVAGAVVAGYRTGVLGTPSGSVEDPGDWGTVSQDRVEVITTVRVDNPNPIGVSSSGRLRAEYDVKFNGHRLVEGSKSDVTVAPGTNRIRLSTFLLTEKLDQWWVDYVRNNETIETTANGTVNVEASATASFGFPPYERTLLSNETPIITSLSNTVSGIEGDYSETVTLDATPRNRQVTVGYEVEDARATWGRVTDEQTTVLLHFRVHNPGDVRMPVVPDGLGLSVDMNDVRLFRATGDELSVRDLGQDRTISPGETREFVFVVTMDNDRIDDWFISHVRNGERTEIAVQLQLVFSPPRTDATIRIPTDSPARHTCTLQTAFLIDNETTATTCVGASLDDSAGNNQLGADLAPVDSAPQGAPRTVTAVDRPTSSVTSSVASTVASPAPRPKAVPVVSEPPVGADPSRTEPTGASVSG